jgi:hypothetical protein
MREVETMRFPAITRVRSTRIWLLALLAGACCATAAPAAQAAEALGVGKFVAANCSEGHEECGSETTTLPPFGFKYSILKEPSPTEAKEQGYTQAAGHPAWGVTDFEVATIEGTKLPNAVPAGLPEGKVVTHVRTDVGPGVSTNPEAVKQCSLAQFGEKEAIPGTGFYEESQCPEGNPESSTVIGVNRVTVYTGSKPYPEGGDWALEGAVYNLEQPHGLAADFGVALKLPILLTEGVLKKAFAEHPLPLEEFPGKTKAAKEAEKEATEKALEEGQYYSHTFIEGHVEWAGNYHDYYEINVSPALPLISSRLILKGNIGNTGLGGFITNPSNCAGPGPATTNTVTLKGPRGEEASEKYETPIGTEGCTGVAPFSEVPFKPAFSLEPETTQSDQPDGLTTELSLPHDPSPTGIDSSQLEDATVTLPEGMTLNPAAAQGLEACTPAQARITSTTPGVACPTGSKIGTDTLDVPDLPPGSLKGDLYLGGPESGPITGPPYTMYLDAESARYGVSVRLKGTVVPNEATGRLTATFAKNPEQPFSDVILHFKGGPLAPLANPLACAVATTETTLVPYIGAFATKSPFSSFLVDSNGSGGACPSPLPFALAQSTSSLPTTAGASTSYALNLTRPAGQQNLSQVRTVLPTGLVGRIPAVALCSETQVAEAQTKEEGCPAASRIGSVTVSAGVGPAPLQLTGSVYLTGPYNGAPYGMAIVVPAAAGPFSLGNVVTRASIAVEPYSPYRVVVTSALPTIWKGIPLRLERVGIEINRQGFLLNPTNCGALSTDSTLTGFTPGSSATATQVLSSPFTVGECGALAFKPSLTAIAGGKPTRANGANIEVNISQGAGQANLKQVTTVLPKQLPVRQSTLTKACPAATFAAGPPPGGCKSESKVGTATATTPVLAGKLTGSAYLVSHGNEAFPNLDLVMQGDGVTVVLVGHTNITNSIITTSFESLPDVPVSSFSLYLPSASNSLLAANGNLCTSNLVMPTTILAQNGAKITQSTKISVRNCPVQIVKHKTAGTTATLTVQAPAAGSISAGGTDLQFNKRNLGKAERTTIKVSLTRVGREVLRKFRQLRIKVRVGFVPKKKGASSKAYATVTFRA